MNTARLDAYSASAASVGAAEAIIATPIESLSDAALSDGSIADTEPKPREMSIAAIVLPNIERAKATTGIHAALRPAAPP